MLNPVDALIVRHCDHVRLRAERGKPVPDDEVKMAQTYRDRVEARAKFNAMHVEALLENEQQKSLTFFIDPGSAPPSVVADVLVAISDLHVAAGGSGLRFEVPDATD